MPERPGARGADLVSELRDVLIRAAARLESLAGNRDPKVDALRNRVRETLHGTRSHLAKLGKRANDARQRVSIASEVYVREHPWTVVGSAAALGLVVGAVVRRVWANRGNER